MLSITNFGDLSWQYGFVFIIVLLLAYRWYKRPHNFPPGPRGVPFLGTLPFMGNFPERAMKKWSKTYGTIFSVRFGPNEMVVLNDYESIQQAFVKDSAKFSGRPKFGFFEKLTGGYGIASLDYNDTWKVQRKFGFLTLRQLGMGKQMLESAIAEEVSYFSDLIREQNGKPFDPAPLTSNAVSNVIYSVCFGKRFEYNDERFKNFLKLMQGTFDDTMMNATLMLLIYAPFMARIPPFTYYQKKWENIVETQMTLVDDIIKEHKDTFDKSNPRDFVDAFLMEMENKSDPSFVEKQLIHYVRDLFEAGIVMTSSTLNWSLLCLVHHPEKQEKLWKEIISVFDTSGQVSWNKRSDMPYTCAFMEEVFRYRTLAPRGVQHATSEDAYIGGYFIPKKTMVTANVWAVHNDETIWDKPEVFNPERFINDKGEFVRSQYVIPFSVGPRHCLGEQLARMELFFFLVTLVRQFEFLPDPDSKELPRIDDGSNGIVFIPKSFKIVAKER